MRRASRRHRLPGPWLGLVVAVAGLAAAGCRPGGTPAGRPEVPAGAEQFCGAYLELSDIILTSPLIQGSGDAPEDRAVVVTEAGKIADALDRMKADAPEAVQSAIVKVSAIFHGIADSGDPAALNDTATLEADYKGIDDWAYEHCGWNQVPVTAVNYAFQDLPPTLPAGRTSLRLTNQATDEEHVMLVTRRQPGVTGSFQDLLAKPGDPFAKDLELVAAVAAAPGAVGSTGVDLAPGDYAFLCPVPQGGKPDGQPHFALGMLQEVTVK